MNEEKLISNEELSEENITEVSQEEIIEEDYIEVVGDTEEVYNEKEEDVI